MEAATLSYRSWTPTWLWYCLQTVIVGSWNLVFHEHFIQMSTGDHQGGLLLWTMDFRIPVSESWNEDHCHQLPADFYPHGPLTWRAWGILSDTNFWNWEPAWNRNRFRLTFTNLEILQRQLTGLDNCQEPSKSRQQENGQDVDTTSNKQNCHHKCQAGLIIPLSLLYSLKSKLWVDMWQSI